MWPSLRAWIMGSSSSSSPPRSSTSVLERARLVELHQRLDTRAERRPASGHRGGLNRLEQLALRGAVLDRALHVRHDAFLPAAEGEDADDHHLAILDRELLALADRQLAERLARGDVFRIFPPHPVPVGVSVGAGRLAAGGLLGRGGGTACGHGEPPLAG